ncbi:MAG: low temperature requirement protein A [Thermomicrobiales bacterium]|nr:low temperature requirement protein A [Thermomicrobiales bacterium]
MTVVARPNALDQTYDAAPLELFFDLVYVFAVAQLAHHLLNHLAWRGGAETLVMLLAVFAVWNYTSWAVSMFPAHRAGTRLMILIVMLLGLFMNASVTRAFTTSGWVFVGPFLMIQLGRTFWTFVNSTGAIFREQYVRTLLWLTAIAPLWVAGAVADPDARLVWWTLAAGLDLAGTWLAHPIPGRQLYSEHVWFEGGHMVERCRLFLMIALGETILATGRSIAAAPLEPMTVVTGTATPIGVAALWALGFGSADRLILQNVGETSDPVPASRHAGNGLIVAVAGLIAVAVANNLAITHPRGHAPAALEPLLFGGSILFLIAQGWYLWAVLHITPRLRMFGCAALAVVGISARLTPPFVALLLASTALAVLAGLERQ